MSKTPIKSQPPETDVPTASTSEFSLEEVDLEEQMQIYEELSSYNETLNDKAIQEALKRSLNEAEGLTMDSDLIDGVGSLNIEGASVGSDENTLVARETAAAAPGRHGSRSPEQGPSHVECSDAEDEEEDLSHARSRREQYKWQQRHTSKRRPSLDRINGHLRSPSPDRLYHSSSERRPSLDRMINGTSEQRQSLELMSQRRPSLERMENAQSERCPSLERMANRNSERRPSLERMANRNSERRPSLERMANRNSERRPSLERMANRNSEHHPSLERMQNGRGERRPSLERLEQYGLGRRSSLEQVQNAAQRVQSLAERGAGEGPGQGVNTLRPPPLNENGIPTNWDPSQLPELGDGTLYRLVSLSPMDREHSAITVDFEEAGLKVFSVQRLQNLELLERFNREKEHLLRHRPPDFELNERYLYHGTRANQECLCEEGLDFRLSFQGCFGRGTYFSDNPRKCMQYATSSNIDYDRGARPMILVCRVLLGDSKTYDHGVKRSELKRGPEKPRTKGGHKYYDSVQGIPVDYPEFVVYDNSRSMIEYIVTFEEVGYRAPPSQYNFYKSQTPSLYKCEPIFLPIPEDELDELYMLKPDTDSDGSCDEHTRDVERLRECVKKSKAQRLGIPFRLPTKEEKRYERLHWKRVCYFSCPPKSPLYDVMIIKKREAKLERMKRKLKEKQDQLEKEGGDPSTLKLDPKYLDSNYTFIGTSLYNPILSRDYWDGKSTAATNATEAVTEPSQASEEASTNVDTTTEDQFAVESDTVGEVLDSLIAEFLSVTTTDDVEAARRYIMENNMDMDQALCQYYREMP